jgi:hypothetical protein
MPEEKKIDPFKPQQPSIPGVVPRAESPKPEAAPAPENAAPSVQPKAQPPQLKLIAVAGAGVLIMLIGLIVWGRSSSHKVAPVSADTSTAPPAAPADTPKPQPTEPTGPGTIATAAELSKPWAAKRFQYHNFVTGQYEPAMVVRLPHGEYWGFSLIEPFGTCQLEFVSDLDKLKTDYGYHADHPMVGDPCNHTLYDLTRYGGGASTDDLVRGVIVQGNGIRPPMAIEIKVQGNSIVAGRSE